ncbi:MAG: hypothetical protein LBD10_13970 [Desulfobulbus sp.]|jgi:hypothetical protein|uniref:hypothetical protein n=1 Tax=Desulfobulbus sp. TaxID=895 RepID=UPI0028430FF0|nr:hypothetical protein [Desulfobulbus sp.]MDR2551298.1 hypothetical protein [Desulfobulbus sp.]
MADRLLLFLLLVVGFILTTGCAPLVPTAGAGTGYMAGQQAAFDAVGSFFDDLGRSIQQTTRKITGTPSPRRRAGTSTATDGLVLKIERSMLVPTEVHSGEQVTLVLRYTIRGASAQGVEVRERSALSSGGKEMTVLKDQTSEKENGTWENTLSFAVPASAKPGKYTVNMQLDAQGKTRSARHSFTVR